MKKFPFLLAILALLFHSCDNSIDLTSDPKEIMVVYGLLNQNETEHYLKITKAFLTDGNAMLAAQNPENSLYAADELEVKVYAYRNGNIIETIVFDTAMVDNKQPGTFYNPKQMVYKAQATLSPLNTYRLHVLNKNTGHEVFSTTSLVEDFTIQKPLYIEGFFIDYITLISTNPNSKFSVDWKSVPSGYLYSATMRINYLEIDKISNDTVKKYLDMGLGTQKVTPQNYNDQFFSEKLSLNITAESFFRFLGQRISINPNVKRKIDFLDFYVTAGTSDLSTYIDVTKPNTGIIQEKPEFTNIENGIGLFSSRFTTVSKAKLSPITVSHINRHEASKNLGFE